MKILHVASFMGNIGDNASHKGLKEILSKVLPQASVTRLEIRKFYKNYNLPDKLSFNEDFIRRANAYDLLIIGGGGFLDYWVPDSMSGTTIDMDPSLVKKITVPTWITSVGCTPFRPVPKGNLLKFKNFIDALLSNSKIKIAVRNDGSHRTLALELGLQYSTSIPEVLDHGFFYMTDDSLNWDLSAPYVAINLTDDQTGYFLQNSSIKDRDSYHIQLADICRHIADNLGMEIVFVPHIHSDIRAIAELSSFLPDSTLRNSIKIAPYMQGNKGADQLFSIYKNSNFVLATRLHANICCLSMNKWVAALAVLDRVKFIHRSIGSNKVLTVNHNFSQRFKDMIGKGINSDGQENSSILEQKKEETICMYRNWSTSL